MNMKRLAIASLMLFISACTVTPTQPTPPEVVPPPVEHVPPAATQTPEAAAKPLPETASPTAQLKAPPKQNVATKPKPYVQKPAVTALLAQAEKAQIKGQHRQAQQQVQRAQRIAPNDPYVYYKLAQIHFDLESYALAEQVALKGVSVSKDQPHLLKKFWLLLADTRSAVGNVSGAKAAKRKADQF